MLDLVSNYHTHTYRCHHAKGSDREFVEAAVSAGLKTLGFSDHAPFPFKNGYVSKPRMALSELGDYFASICALRDEFADKIDIHIGLEAEYYVALWPEFKAIIADYPCEYLLLGHHYYSLDEQSSYLGVAFDDAKLLELYTDQVVAAIESGDFLYVAHPDIANFTGSEKAYSEQARRICRAAKAAGMPLEVNALGMRELRWYPRGLFFEAAAEEGNDLIIGVDAHHPKHFTDEDAEAAVKDCRDFAESFGLKLLDSMPL